MFGFFKRQPKKASGGSPQDYQAEFQRLTQALYDKFAIEDTPYDLLLDAMAAVETEMNRNGGKNWSRGDYEDYLDILGETLLVEGQFTAEQLAKIGWSLEEIAECGRELKDHGESARPLDEPIDYLIARVVDWCHAHPVKPDEDV